MANVLAIHSVGHSIATFLRNTYPNARLAGVNMPSLRFQREMSSRRDGRQHRLTPSRASRSICIASR